MKKFNFSIVLIVGVLITFLSSCKKNETALDQQSKSFPEIAKKLEALSFNANDLELIDFVLPDGTTQEMFQIEGHIVFSEEQINNMKVANLGTKQYNTYNLVNPGVYHIAGLGLNSKLQTALEMAVENFNELNLDIQFKVDPFGTIVHDIVVYEATWNNTGGGQSGFPSDGKPFSYVLINGGTDSYNIDVIEHVMTHEIGHTIGLRHTDWFSRESCGGDPVNEGETSYGAVHIPGTPTGYDPTSLMNSCFSGDEDGEFNNNDKIALQYLY